MEWISVKDKLPEVHPATDGDYWASDFVLVYFGDGVLNKICVANYEVDGEDKCLWVSFSDTGTGDMAYDVTHWMPLPEPPKE